MPMLGIDNIHDKEGKLLSTILEELKGGSNGEPVDLKDYAKTSDIKEVKDMIEGLISDLKAGKYNVASEVKEDKKVAKAEKVESK